MSTKIVVSLLLYISVIECNYFKSKIDTYIIISLSGIPDSSYEILDYYLSFDESSFSKTLNLVEYQNIDLSNLDSKSRYKNKYKNYKDSHNSLFASYAFADSIAKNPTGDFLVYSDFIYYCKDDINRAYFITKANIDILLVSNRLEKSKGLYNEIKSIQCEDVSIDEDKPIAVLLSINEFMPLSQDEMAKIDLVSNLSKVIEVSFCK